MFVATKILKQQQNGKKQRKFKMFKMKEIIDWINGWAGWGFVIGFMLFVLSLGYYVFGG